MIERIATILSIALLVILFSLPSASHQARVIYSVDAGACRLTVEADDQSRTLRLRVNPEGNTCRITRDAMLGALRATFLKTDPPRLEGTYSSLSIGRVIDYPWLSQYLARAAHNDTRWDGKRGKPVAMDINKYVSVVLSEREVTAHIDRALAGSGYRVTSVHVEKVLVGGFRDVPLYEGETVPGRIPYDAQAWFRLEKK